MSRPKSFCPYVGLQPYTDADRDYFFGRKHEIQSICSNLQSARLTVLFGPSGVGKSSILMAGVVPRLEKSPHTAVLLFREWKDDPKVPLLAKLKAACFSAVTKVNPTALEQN